MSAGCQICMLQGGCAPGSARCSCCIRPPSTPTVRHTRVWFPKATHQNTQGGCDSASEESIMQAIAILFNCQICGISARNHPKLSAVNTLQQPPSCNCQSAIPQRVQPSIDYSSHTSLSMSKFFSIHNWICPWAPAGLSLLTASNCFARASTNPRFSRT